MLRAALARVGKAALGLLALVHGVFAVLVWPSENAPVQFVYRAVCRQQSGVECGPDAERSRDILEAYLNVRPTDPLTSQYLDYTSALLTGDLGRSIWYGEPVTTILVGVLPVTLALLLIAWGLAALVGVALGIRGRFGDPWWERVAVRGGGVFVAATPAVLAAVLAVSGLAVTLIDPMSWKEARRIAGFAEAPAPFSSGDPALAALAVAVLALVGAGPWVLGAARRLRSEPVHGARLRGLSALRAGWVGWTADTPRATARATHTWIWFCSVLPLVEYLLRIRGVGWYLVRAVPARDYPLLLGSLLALAAIALLGALALELVAVVLDPRDRERWWSRPPAPADEPPSAPLAPFDRPP